MGDCAGVCFIPFLDPGNVWHYGYIIVPTCYYDGVVELFGHPTRDEVFGADKPLIFAFVFLEPDVVDLRSEADKMSNAFCVSIEILKHALVASKEWLVFE